MKSKLTKTIFTIVFVVFLGLININKVEAFYAYCHYKTDDLSARALIYIADSFETAKGNFKEEGITSFLSGKKIKNWASSGTTKITYTAYKDAWTNDQCPQYLLYASSSSGFGAGSDLYMSDADNLENYKEVLSSNYDNVLVLTIDSNTFPNQKSEHGTYIPARICSCDNDTTYSIAEGGDLGAPKVGGKTVQNWLNVKIYSAIDSIKSNECLDLIYSSDKNKVYMSDASHYEEVYSMSGGNEVVKCKISSQTPIAVEKPKPEYNPPTVNTGIVNPLTPNAGTYSCGDGYMTDIPSGIIRFANIFYTILQILVPVALVILGSLDLVKAMAAQKEDEIKRGQQVFIKRLIAAVIIFFVFMVVKLIVGVFSNDNSSIIECMNCFLQGTEECD